MESLTPPVAGGAGRGARLRCHYAGGERQRIAIARALIKPAPVLVLDEATANLDPLTEDAVRDTVLKIGRSTTVLVVAHRLRVVAALDRIIVLEKGAVVEDGTHDALLERNGLYRKLWEIDCEKAAGPSRLS